MRRRAVVAALVGAPLMARAQPAPSPGRIHRLGAPVFTTSSADLIRRIILPGLQRAGFVEGRNLILDVRIGTPQDVPGLSRDLVASKPDAILAVGNVAAVAAKTATATIPIVLLGSSAVELGWADSLARPASNLTGLLMLGPELDGKRLELLRRMLPEARCFGAMIQPSSPSAEARRQALRATAKDLDVDIVLADAAGPDDYPAVFAAFRKAGAKGLVVGSDPIFFRDIAVLSDFASEAGLATICHWREMVQGGCLLSYGPQLSGLCQRIAELLARIFAGAGPGSLPIEGPTRFEFIVNLAAARKFGFEIPKSVLARADEVVE